MSWTRGAGRLVPLVLLVALTGCSDAAQEQPSPPPGSVQLRENVPTPVGEAVLVASNIWDDSIVLSVSSDGGPAESADLVVGGTATVDGRAFELLSIHEDTADTAPGGSGSYAWVLPLD